MLLGKGHVSQDIFLTLQQHLGGLGPAGLEFLGHVLQLLSRRLAVGLSEDSPHRCCDHRLVALGDVSQNISHEVHPAALPTCTS